MKFFHLYLFDYIPAISSPNQSNVVAVSFCIHIWGIEYRIVANILQPVCNQNKVQSNVYSRIMYFVFASGNPESEWKSLCVCVFQLQSFSSDSRNQYVV